MSVPLQWLHREMRSMSAGKLTIAKAVPSSRLNTLMSSALNAVI